MWKSTDPRIDIYKRADIIILKPTHFGWTAGIGKVETHHGYDICTSFDDNRYINEWDQDWLWALAPERKT